MIQEEAISELLRAAAELDAHLTEIDGSTPEIEVRCQQHGLGVMQAQMWWVNTGSPLARDLLWDYLDVQVTLSERPKWIEQCRAAGLRAEFVEASAYLQGEDRRNCPMFDFHPQRFRQHNPVGKALARVTAPPFVQEVLERSMDATTASSQDLGTRPLRRTVKLPVRQLMLTAQLGMFFHAWVQGGRQIFDFPTHMVDLFRRTDVDGIPLELLKLPFPHFYMHFGPQHDLEMDGWMPDGVYVSHNGVPGREVIQFGVTYYPTVDIDYSRVALYEPTYIQAMYSKHLHMGVGEAVDLVFAERLAELRKQAAGRDDPLSADDRSLAAAVGVELVDGRAKFASQEMSSVSRRHEGWLQMLRLVVNGLAYLSAYPRDNVTQWPANAPSDLVSALSTSRKATSKLAQLGFTAITVCGQSLRQPSAQGGACSDDIAGDVDFTWVRGHWRRFAVGEGRTERRLRWLMPHKRSLHKAGDTDPEMHGHVYQVT